MTYPRELGGELMSFWDDDDGDDGGEPEDE